MSDSEFTEVASVPETIMESGFKVFSENGTIWEALGIPFITGRIWTVKGRFESFACNIKPALEIKAPIGKLFDSMKKFCARGFI